LESETRHLHDLLVRWQAGDRSAADALCRRVARRLELLARKMIGRFPNVRVLADTDDVFQDAMMRLLHTLTTLRPATTRDFFNLAAVHLRRTLLDLSRRVASRPDLHRRRSMLESKDSRDDPIEELADPGPLPEDLERWCQFHEAIERLPVAERQVMDLVFYHGWSQERIAELFQVDERTVRRWWRHACDRIALELGGQFPSPTDRP
jgi:RNA polymerase sigma-70 factor (ECF subfamily)